LITKQVNLIYINHALLHVSDWNHLIWAFREKRSQSYPLTRLTSGPYFSYFSYFSLLFDPEPYFSLLFEKQPYYSYFFGVSCCQIKVNTLKTCLFTLIFNILCNFCWKKASCRFQQCIFLYILNLLLIIPKPQ